MFKVLVRGKILGVKRYMPSNDTTISIPADVATAMTALVRSGEFQSEGDVARAAMEEWQARRAPADDALALLRADVAIGLADVAAGRTKEFDINRIAALGRQASKGHSRSD